MSLAEEIVERAIRNKQGRIKHTIEYEEISKDEAIEIARKEEPYYSIREIITVKGEHYITKKPTISEGFISFPIYFMIVDDKYFKSVERYAHISLSICYVEKMESYSEHKLPFPPSKLPID